MSVEKPSQGFDSNNEVDLDLYTDKQLAIMITDSLGENFDISSASRHELLRTLEALKIIEEELQPLPIVEAVVAKEPTPEEIASLYFATFDCRPAFSLSLEDQKAALANIDAHKYELFREKQEERNEEKRAHHH